MQTKPGRTDERRENHFPDMTVSPDSRFIKQSDNKPTNVWFNRTEQVNDMSRLYRQSSMRRNADLVRTACHIF